MAPSMTAKKHKLSFSFAFLLDVRALSGDTTNQGTGSQLTLPFWVLESAVSHLKLQVCQSAQHCLVAGWTLSQ